MYFSLTLSVHRDQAVNGYPTLFSVGEGEGGEEEAWYLTSVTPLPVQVGPLTASSPTTIMGNVVLNQTPIGTTIGHEAHFPNDAAGSL